MSQKNPKSPLKIILWSLICALSSFGITQAFDGEISLLSQKSDKLSQLNSVITETTEELQLIKSEKANLMDQIGILRRLNSQNKIRITDLQAEITLKSANIKTREVRLETVSSEVNHLKELLKKYVINLHKESSKTTLEMLIGSETLAEAIKSVSDMERIEAEGQKIFAKVRALQEELTRDKQKVTTDINHLKLLKQEALGRQREITLASQARNTLLSISKDDESQFQRLLQAARTRQAELEDEIDNLTSNLASDHKDIVTKLASQASVDFIWPVDPSRGLTAHFQDDAYHKYFGIPHQAIDIRVAQGTAIQAPAFGFVMKTFQHGTDYSFILLAHSGNIFTLFGHVSEISVQVGDMVDQGQIIGKTGGMPGTKGAGIMTTGPHLHLEIHKGQTKIDPLLMLPSFDQNKK